MSMVDDRLTAEERQRLHALLQAPLAGDVFQALGSENARIVGGAVRNALLGAPVKDIDFATTLPPEEVMARLARAGFSMHPVGIDHGSVLAARDGQTFEITTLRRDVKTDGRHAEVMFTDDWEQDARRRDFTMNALYLDAAGHLHDHVGGLDDARARRLRFIGDAARRIAEDYLRILRYFRLLAEYAANAPADDDTLATIAATKEGLRRISRERIRAEMQRLLQADGASRALELMQRTGVDGLVLPADCARDRMALQRMMQQDAALGLAADWLLRLLAFCGVRESLKQPLKLTRAEAQRLQTLQRLLRRDALPRDEMGRKRLIYRHGAQTVRDLARLAAAHGWLAGDDLRAVLALADAWRPPVFPLRGRDVIAAGVAPGAAVGKTLRKLEERWLRQGFRPDTREALLRQLREMPKEEKP